MDLFRETENLTEQKLGLVDELEAFGRGLTEINILKQKGEELITWCMDAREGLKSEDEVVKAINSYRTKLCNVLDDIKFQFEYLSGEELAKVIKSMFPAKPPKPNTCTHQPKAAKPKVEEKNLAFWE